MDASVDETLRPGIKPRDCHNAHGEKGNEDEAKTTMKAMEPCTIFYSPSHHVVPLMITDHGVSGFYLEGPPPVKGL